MISIFGQPENCSSACREILNVIHNEPAIQSRGGWVYSVWYCCIVQHVVGGLYTQSSTVVLYNMSWRVGILSLVLLYCTTCRGGLVYSV